MDRLHFRDKDTKYVRVLHSHHEAVYALETSRAVSNLDAPLRPALRLKTSALIASRILTPVFYQPRWQTIRTCPQVCAFDLKSPPRCSFWEGRQDICPAISPHSPTKYSILMHSQRYFLKRDSLFKYRFSIFSPHLPKESQSLCNTFNKLRTVSYCGIS